MNISFVDVTNKFIISFSLATDKLIIKDICLFFNSEIKRKIFVDCWLFLNKMGKLGEYLRVNNAEGNLNFEKNAREFISRVKDNIDIDEEMIFDLEEEEVAFELKKLGFKRAGELTISQKRNISFLLKNAVGADFSVPGGGKTTTAYALYCFRKSRNSNLKMLVLCPKNGFESWELENKSCFKTPIHICRLDGGAENIGRLLKYNFNIFLITYEQLLTSFIHVEKFLCDNDVSIYLDECHKIKGGFKGKIGRKVLNLSHFPQYKNIMSGTPAPNRLSDLVSLYEFLYPLEIVSDKTVVDKIQSVYVRTTKRDLKLPDYKVTKTKINMSDEYKKLYNLLIGRELELLRTKDISYTEMIKIIRKCVIKMIQLASNPKLLLKTNPELQSLAEFKVVSENIPPKIKIAVARAFKLAAKGQKIILWSNFIENIKYLEKLLEPLNAISIYGETPTGDSDNPMTREGKLKKFRECKNDYFVLIANPMAACEGVSLQNACYYQIFVDRNYDARLFEQAINRIHRLGLLNDRRVEIEILMLEGTIDMNIDKALDNKLRKMYNILNDIQISIECEQEFDEDEYIRELGSYSGMDERDARNLLHSLN